MDAITDNKQKPSKMRWDWRLQLLSIVNVLAWHYIKTYCPTNIPEFDNFVYQVTLWVFMLYFLLGSAEFYYYVALPLITKKRK